MKNKRIDTSGNAHAIGHNPFAGLDAAGFRNAPPPSTPAPSAGSRKEPNRDRGRVDVIRQTAGRGGKTVTVLSGFKGIAARELEELARLIRKASGVGGTVKEGAIEIQGDQREKAEAVLREAGFRPVRAGG
ncbi:MAG: translation initiation factor [Opitutaceae bacterium]